MFNILMVGRINSWKGQDLLLEALTLLEPNLRTRIHVKILGDVYGNSEMLIELQALVSLQLSDAMITFEGFKSDTQPYYQWADAVIVPSKKPEPFGLVAIEAMSAARDVVVADHGGLSEIVEHQVSGIKVEPNNALALAHALEELLFGKTSYGEAARERFLSHFSQALLEERMRAIFKYSATAKRGATEDGGDALDEDS
jgi:glycosyltransferase involved in cell wall biosynthesis